MDDTDALPQGPLELPVFDEAAELFGEPAADDISERLGGIFGLVIARNDENTASEILATASVLAAATQGDAYSQVLDAAMKTGVDLGGADHAQLRDLFHRSARYGEARMLSKIIATLFTLFETADAPPTIQRH